MQLMDGPSSLSSEPQLGITVDKANIGPPPETLIVRMVEAMTHGTRTDPGLEMLQITCMIRLVWMAWLSMAQLPRVSFWICQVVVATLPVVVVPTSRFGLRSCQ